MVVAAHTRRKSLRARQKVGKYRIEKRLGEGGFAFVYQAMDTIEGVRVALKIPFAEYITEEVLKDFRNEVRIAARLDHPNILRLKDASIIEGRFVLTYPLGVRSLGDRLQKRLSVPTALDYAEQMLDAVAYAHEKRIVHCDIKPENVILFDNRALRLGDFGIAKVAQKTLKGRGTGTVGHMAPEQAMGRPSTRSDVFSLGLVIYRMLTGRWPEWPYRWPLDGYEVLRRKVHPDMIALLRKSLDLRPPRRHRDANDMYDAFVRARRNTEAFRLDMGH